MLASRAALALLAFYIAAPAAISAFAQTEPTASRPVTITCEKIVEEENTIHVSRLRLVLVANGASDIAIVDGVVKRSENDEAIDHTEKVFSTTAKCEAVKGQPLHFTCSIGDLKSRISSLKGEGNSEDGAKTFTLTRVNRDSSIQQMKFDVSDCEAK